MSLSKILPLLQNYDALLIANGTAPSKAMLKLLHQCSGKLIAVDGGLNSLAKHKIIPDFVIGDFDSAEEKNLNWAKKNRAKLVLKKSQNEPDFVKALKFCLEKKYYQISIIGFDGTRPDHILNSLYSIFNFPKLKISLFTTNTISFPVSGKVTKSLVIPKKFSVSWLPIEPSAGCSLNGVKWSFQNRKLSSSTFYSLSNQPKDEEITLKQSSGKSLFTIGFNL